MRFHFNTFSCFPKILLIIFILFDINIAGNRNIRFEHLGLNEGLSQASVLCILQDRQGFLWFGTEDGLNKYDGYKFDVYRHNPDDRNSLSNNYIWSIFEDTEGSLWIGTRNGLNKFNKKTEKFTHFQNEPENLQSLSNSYIRSIFKDSMGILWIGTNDGLNKLVLSDVEESSRKIETFTRFQYQPDNLQSLSHSYILSIFEDTRGSLWIGTENGLNKFDRKTETFTRFQNRPGDPKSLSSSYVRSIFEDSRGSLWIGTENGLNKLVLSDVKGSNRKTETFIRFQNQTDDPQSLSNNIVWSIFEDGGSCLWIGTGGGGLNKFDRKAERFTRYQNQPAAPQSISNNFVRSIYEDAGGSLWIGTFGGGLNKFDRRAEIFTRFENQADNPQSLSNNIVRSIFEDSRGSIWIGTFGGGLNKFDRKTEKFTCYQNQAENLQSLSNNNVSSIFEDTQGVMWFGTEGGGLNRFDRKKETFIRFQNKADDPQSLINNTVLVIYEDSGGSMWIGTPGGLNKFNKKNSVFTRFQNKTDDPQSLSNNFIRSIFEDSEGSMWIGTYGGGLNKFDKKTEEFTCFQNQADYPQSLSNNYVRSIFEDEKSTLWIGTSGGLNKFDRKTKKFSHFREKDGLPNDVIYGILKDDTGNLWLSTNKGISRFNPQTETFTNYNEKDGLQSDEFNAGAYHRGRSGRLYFGGIKGFNEFYPDSIKGNKIIPPVVITDFLLFNKSVSVGDSSVLEQNINFTKEIILDYTDYIFSFEFSALNFYQPEKNQFAYKLEGFNKDWIVTDYKHRRAAYTNLPAGDYIFRVKASNDDGLWNEAGTSIKLIILPPYWQTAWFRGLIILLIAGLLLLAYKLRTHSINQKNLELNKHNLKLNKEISERKKIEDALRRSEEKFRGLVESSSDWIWEVDENGVYTYSSPQVTDLLGYLPEEMIGKRPLDFMPEQEADRVGEIFQSYMKLNKSFVELININLHKTGTKVILDTNGVPFFDDDGNLAGYRGIDRDITERKQAEEELQKLAAVVRYSGEIVNLAALDGNMVFLNEAGGRILGIDPQKATQVNIMEVIPEHLLELVESELMPTLMRGDIWEGDLQYKNLQTGDLTDVHAMTFTIKDPDTQEPLFFANVSMDITERKKAEEELRHLRNYLSNIIDSMPSMLIGVDSKGNITQWNREAERITELSSKEALGRPLDMAIPRLSAEIVRMQKAMQTREVLTNPRQMSKTAGEVRYEDVTIYPLLAEGVEGAVIRIDDVTDKVRMEEMMIQSEKMLSVGGLAAGMAHEINNPLAGMMQTASVMRDRLTNLEMPANQRAAQKTGTSMDVINSFMEERGIINMLGRIAESGRRAAEIVSNMLSFARKSEASFSTCNIAILLDQTVDLAGSDFDLKKKFDFRQIEIIREYEDDLPEVKCESGKIQQVFLNILRNGAESMNENMEKNKASRFVLRLAFEREREMIRIEIEDNGLGMDEDIRRRVFEPFFTTKPADRGTGLGLSVSYFIITENHEGEMIVESSPGMGTNFIIRLPLERHKSSRNFLSGGRN